ncbi:pilus assembly protein [Inquilinus limosus]|uniref:TadE/TadG family type IV pilus assembly protein n=1 Tax=Inquilinus limosus TaxID=171674 RepID=UPI003F1542E5
MIFSARRATRAAGRRRPAAFSDESGLAAVEFALVAPVFVMLLFGIIIFGIHFGTWLAVNQAAAEGARASVAGMDLGERRELATSTAEAVLAAYGPILGDTGWTVDAKASDSDPRLFEVTVTYDQAARNAASGLQGDSGDDDSLIVLPLSNPTATVIVANGGY